MTTSTPPPPTGGTAEDLRRKVKQANELTKKNAQMKGNQRHAP